jgi:hypothetical protein
MTLCSLLSVQLLKRQRKPASTSYEYLSRKKTSFQIDAEVAPSSGRDWKKGSVAPTPHYNLLTMQDSGKRGGKFIFVVILSLAAGTVALLVRLHFHALNHFVQRPGARMASLPRVTLWAWERPESFVSMDKSRAAIAYLDQTISISNGQVTSRPREVPVIFPKNAVRIAVVRIEVAPGSTLSKQVLADTTRLLLNSASTPGIAAFQVDFDARRSEREFYRTLLLRLRASMPPALPLSITALASWCAYDDWIHDLPVDEAVPMFFRMEPEWRHADLHFEEYKLHEPLCAGSIGLANTGSWPPVTDGRRIYLFADSGWTPQAVKSALDRIH